MDVYTLYDGERAGLWMCTCCRNMPHMIDRILTYMYVESLAETVTGVQPAIRKLTQEDATSELPT